jgi:DNA-binding CsgD family transcriptional regulator
VDVLTLQELQIAQLVATGGILRKLGITSRHQLRELPQLGP